MMKFKEIVRNRLWILAMEDRTTAARVLREYGVEVFNQLPGYQLKAFAASVRDAHIRYLLKRLEDISLS